MRFWSKNAQDVLGAGKCANSVRRGNVTTRRMVSLLLALCKIPLSLPVQTPTTQARVYFDYW